MTDWIELDPAYSTTRRVRKVAPQVVKAELKAAHKPEDLIETILFQPEGEGRKGEGGLRTQGYFKKTSEEKPLITVITVVFNGEKHLENTILSVLNQTYQNIEYIIIDGGSSDETVNIIKKYEHAIDYWCSEKDNGIYDAMNKGIDLVAGEWINFMNSDDKYFGNSTIEIISENISKYVSVIYGDAIISSGKYKKYVAKKKFSRINLIIWSTRVVCHQAMFVRKKIVPKYNTRYILKAELDWYFAILSKKTESRCVNFPVCRYSLGGISDRLFKLEMKETISPLMS